MTGLTNLDSLSSELNYLLMNKNTALCKFNIVGSGDIRDCSITERYKDLPEWMPDLYDWLTERNAAKHRAHISRILEQCNSLSIEGFIKFTHCLSLNDTLWVKSDGEEIGWEELSLYKNNFNEVVSKTAFDGKGLYGIQLSTTSPEMTTDGMYDKCWIKDGDNISLIKTGSSGASNSGLEPYGEVLASHLFDKLCNSVKYTLENYRGRVVSKCSLFTSEKFGYKSFATVIRKAVKEKELIEIYDKLGCLDELIAMIVTDCITLNSDRHFGNFGFTVNNDTFEIITINPVFDFNRSFVPYAVESSDFPVLEQYLKDRGPVIGSDYVTLGKQIMTSSLRSKLINLKDLTLAIEVDEKFTKRRLDCINEIKNRQIDALLGKTRPFYFKGL